MSKLSCVWYFLFKEEVNSNRIIIESNPPLPEDPTISLIGSQMGGLEQWTIHFERQKILGKLLRMMHISKKWVETFGLDTCNPKRKLSLSTTHVTVSYLFDG